MTIPNHIVSALLMEIISDSRLTLTCLHGAVCCSCSHFGFSDEIKRSDFEIFIVPEGGGRERRTENHRFEHFRNKPHETWNYLKCTSIMPEGDALRLTIFASFSHTEQVFLNCKSRKWQFNLSNNAILHWNLQNAFWLSFHIRKENYWDQCMSCCDSTTGITLGKAFLWFWCGKSLRHVMFGFIFMQLSSDVICLIDFKMVFHVMRLRRTIYKKSFYVSFIGVPSSARQWLSNIGFRM